MEQHVFDHEKRLGQIEAKVDDILSMMGQRFDDLNLHIQDVAVTQLRDHGKRIGVLEKEVSAIQQTMAEERGTRAGSKAMLALVLSIVGAVAGAVGSFLSRLVSW